LIDNKKKISTVLIEINLFQQAKEEKVESRKSSIAEEKTTKVRKYINIVTFHF
jgi:hypothetical protein